MKTTEKSVTDRKTASMLFSKHILGLLCFCFFLSTSNTCLACDNQFTLSYLTDNYIEHNEYIEELPIQVADSSEGFFSGVFSFIKQLFLLIIILAALGFLVYLISSIYRYFRQVQYRVNDLEKKVNRYSKQSACNGYDKLELQQLQRSIHNISDDINELKIRLEWIEKQNGEKSSCSKSESDKNNQENQANDEYCTFFMPPPGENNYFSNNNKSSHLDIEKHAYEFSLSNDTDKRAHFKLINDNTVIEKALNYPNPFLKSACEVENFHINNPARIIIVEPGIVEKNEDKWIIIRKSAIRYD